MLKHPCHELAEVGKTPLVLKSPYTIHPPNTIQLLATLNHKPNIFINFLAVIKKLICDNHSTQKVAFRRERIVASSPNQIPYFVWAFKGPNLLPKPFLMIWLLSHLETNFILLQKSIPRFATKPPIVLPWLE